MLLPLAVPPLLKFSQPPRSPQVQATLQADVLMGMHGAGLTHLIFTQPGAAVVELFPYGAAIGMYRQFASLSGRPYFRCGDALQARAVRAARSCHTPTSEVLKAAPVGLLRSWQNTDRALDHPVCVDQSLCEPGEPCSAANRSRFACRHPSTTVGPSRSNDDTPEVVLC